MIESLESTKLRLVREAIQDNFARIPRPARKVRRQPRRLPVLVLSILVLLSVTYVSWPSHSIPSASVPIPAAPAIQVTQLSAGALAARPEPSVAGLLPRRLDRTVLPLAVKKIVLDPGHGGDQLGAVADSGLSEKEITLDLAIRVRRLLDGDPFAVVLTRDRDEPVTLEQRVALANAASADLFVSIHVNWLPRRGIRPLETYYAGPTQDGTALRLASLENRESGYSLADYRRLLERVYLDTRRDESRTLATAVHTELAATLGRFHPGLENRGVKTAPFVVLIGTEMPAILAEVSSLSNPGDIELLTSADYRERIATALTRGIRSYANGLTGIARKGG